MCTYIGPLFWGGGGVVTVARALRPTYAPGGPFIVYTGKQSYSRIFSEWNVLKRKKNKSRTRRVRERTRTTKKTGTVPWTRTVPGTESNLKTGTVHEKDKTTKNRKGAMDTDCIWD